MPTAAMIHVHATPHAMVPFYGDDGRAHAGRFVGRARHDAQAIDPSGETVADSIYIRRAIERGDLTIAATGDDR